MMARERLVFNHTVEAISDQGVSRATNRSNPTLWRSKSLPDWWAVLKLHTVTVWAHDCMISWTP
jgi:hypothetical protein